MYGIYCYDSYPYKSVLSHLWSERKARFVLLAIETYQRGVVSYVTTLDHCGPLQSHA